MVILSRKIAVGVLACCFVFGVYADSSSDSEEQSDVRGNYWGFRMNRQGDGPIEVETEQSVYNKDGIVQSKKESGHLEFDRFGRAYIKKAGESGKTEGNQPKAIPALTPALTPTSAPTSVPEGDRKAEAQNAFPKSLCLRQHSDKKNCRRDHRQHIVAGIKRELADIGTLIEQEVADRTKDEDSRYEVYRFIKKKLRKIKKAAKILLTESDEERYEGKEKGGRWLDFIGL
jgi:hypothetical protein